MRSFIYDAIGKTCIVYAGVTDFVAGVIVAVVVKIGVFSKVNFAHLCMWLLKRVDGKRVQAEQEEIEALRTQLELGLMQAAVRIKESALADQDWT